MSELSNNFVGGFNLESRTDVSDYDYQLIEADGNIIDIDPDNAKFFQAFELIKTTNRTTYITGKAGTGKTTLLKFIKKNISKNTAVVSYTGVAAINAGGQTIHSFFKINPHDPPFIPNDPRLRFKRSQGDTDTTTIYSHFKYRTDRKEIMEKLELLIIDEVSMVRADLIDVIDRLLRAFSGKGRNKSFGGVQVVLIGDTFQLPPIEGEEWNLLNNYYESPFFFSSNAFRETPPIYIELEKIYRQSEQVFISLLNRIRVNQPTNEDITTLNSKLQPLSDRHFEENYIILCSTNSQVNEINVSRLNSINGTEKTYTGIIEGEFPQKYVDLNLHLKVGAQIMFLKNTTNFFNGKIGKIVSLENDVIYASTKNSLGEETTFEVEKATWQNVRYYLNHENNRIEQEVIGTLTQYPLKLAWAITVHKSQGLTFDKVIININDFAPSGLVYVALSRCTSMNGIVLIDTISRENIKVDPRVIDFAQNVTPNTLIVDAINYGKADQLYAEARTAIKENDFEGALTFLYKALKYRNDIETEEFKRYILLQLKRIGHYSELLNNSRSEVIDLTEKLYKLSEALLLMRDNDIKSKKEIDRYKKSNDQLKAEINRLKNLSWFDRLLGKK